MSRPRVIDDEEHERVYERVAGIDVAKDAEVVCTRIPHPSRVGARRSTVWTVKARMRTIGALGRQLEADGIEMVTLEFTSDCWRIWVRREADCRIARAAGGNRRRFLGSDGLPVTRKVSGAAACQETAAVPRCQGQGAGRSA